MNYYFNYFKNLLYKSTKAVYLYVWNQLLKFDKLVLFYAKILRTRISENRVYLLFWYLFFVFLFYRFVGEYIFVALEAILRLKL